VDEAGRGPVIGPMVICGVLAERTGIKQLKKIGVRDSKTLTRKGRIEIIKKIMPIVEEFYLIIVSSREIDKWVAKKQLNILESWKMAEIINTLSPQIVFIDAPMKNTLKFKMLVAEKVNMDVDIVAENYADRNHALVSAASIIAKVERDRIIDEYQKVYGHFGSGYPSDPKTIEFLITYLNKDNELPEIVRKTWKTLKKLKQREVKTE
jgi:ribonuclease HII